MATLFNTRIADTYQGLLKTLDTAIIGSALTQISDGSGNGTGIFLNTGGDLEATGIVSFGSLKDTAENITITKFVDAADGLANNDNDTTIPTSAAIIDYVAAQVTLADLDFLGDSNVGLPSVDLDSQKFNVLGTANQITTSGSGQTLTISLPNSVTISGDFTATTFLGDLNGTINTLTTAVTQPLGDNSTKIATTAFVDRVITAQDLDFQGTTGSGSVDLDSQVLIIKGTTNEITTVGGAQTLTIGLPLSITTNLVGNVTGNVVGNITGDVTGDLTGNTTGLHTGNVVGNVTGDLTGNADTATAWANGRTITLTGEATGVTSSIDGTASVSAALTLTNSAVIGKILTGLQSPAGATILATDSMLLAFGKLQSQINGIAEGLQFQGSWNASTNTPTLTSGVGTQGHYYIVSVAGSTDLDGITDWEVGDWAIYSTTSVWQRLDQTGVQGTGTTGNLTKWATGSTISDSIVSESGTALTVTGSLTTTLATTVSGNLTVGTDSLIVNSVSDAVSMAGILTVASPVINTGISGSAVLDDDTFATANATTVATTESIKAYIDSNTGSGTAGKIPKFAAGGESLDDSIIDQSSGNVTINTLGTGTSKLQVVGGIRNWNSALTLSSRLETDGLYFSGAQDAYIVSQQALNFYAGNAQKLSISSGGVATFSGNVGINASNPVKTLDVRGQLAISNNATSYYYIDRNDTDGNFEIKNDSDSNLLTISSGGLAKFTPNGGNGTGAVNALHLKNTGTSANDGTSILFTAGTSADGAAIKSTGQAFNSSDLRFFTGGSAAANERLTITSGGDATFSSDVNLQNGKYLIFRRSSGNLAVETLGIEAGTDDVRLLTTGAFKIQNGSLSNMLVISTGGEITVKKSITTEGLITDSSFPIYKSKLSGAYTGGWGSLAVGTVLGGLQQSHVRTDGGQVNIAAAIDFLLANNTYGTGQSEISFKCGGVNGVNSTEKMRIASTGLCTINATAPNGSNLIVYNNSSTTPYGMALILPNGTSDDTRYLYYGESNGAAKFKVTTSGKIYAVNTTVQSISDVRFKENIRDLDTGLSEILQLKPRLFDWKEGKGMNTKDSVGFIAQEIEEVLPKLVDNNWSEDGIDEKGAVIEGEKYKTVGQGGLIPTLVKAIQEQQTIIDTLTARLDVLENKA